MRKVKKEKNNINKIAFYLTKRILKSNSETFILRIFINKQIRKRILKIKIISQINARILSKINQCEKKHLEKNISIKIKKHFR